MNEDRIVKSLWGAFMLVLGVNYFTNLSEKRSRLLHDWISQGFNRLFPSKPRSKAKEKCISYTSKQKSFTLNPLKHQIGCQGTNHSKRFFFFFNLVHHRGAVIDWWNYICSKDGNTFYCFFSLLTKTYNCKTTMKA